MDATQWWKVYGEPLILDRLRGAQSLLRMVLAVCGKQNPPTYRPGVCLERSSGPSLPNGQRSGFALGP
jgi:hypothetical protein